MYCLSEKQIDYILNDISARGVEMESLQLNLHDHICCIIEQNLEENGDFESFYQKTIKTFYKDEIWEIEEETLLLLTYKNYYAMKKIMILSGTFSAATMILGILFKFMHWPGAPLFIQLGIGTSSLIFLPLLYLLKSKDKPQIKEKIILALGILSGILISLSILFKIMHWPYAMIMGYSSVFILGLILLPIYFITGIKNPENKINTITISIVIIMICGLWLTLVRSPNGSRIKYIKDTNSYLINEKIVETEKKLCTSIKKNDSTKNNLDELSVRIVNLCDKIKSSIIFCETGVTSISENFEIENHFIMDKSFRYYDNKNEEIDSLVKLIGNYNLEVKTNSLKNKIPLFYNDSDNNKNYLLFIGSNIEVLNHLTQIQLITLQNQR